MSLGRLRKSIEQIESSRASSSDEATLLLEQWHSMTVERLSQFSESKANTLDACVNRSDLRTILRSDLFLLLSAGCQRFDMLNSWCLERCEEVQAKPNGYLDLWARDHYKSTIITFGHSIFDIINSHGDDREGYCTIGIFSFTRPIAKAFLRQIKLELERNEILKILFHDIFFQNPKGESSKWSEDEGLLVKRKTNPKEATIEAWGLIEGQPTSKHYSICIYDDMITHDTARTKYSMEMATRSWENSLNLSTKEGVRRYVGTRKHLSDTYSTILDRQGAVKRLYTPYTDEREKEGVLLTADELTQKRREMGEITFASEMLQDPLLDTAMGLDVSLLQEHSIEKTAHNKLTIFMVCDPASGKNKKSDYTVYSVLAIDKDLNLLLLDGIRDRLNPSQRWDTLLKLYEQYPEIVKIYYEQAGMNEDIHNFKVQMNRTGRYFDNKMVSLSPRGSKENRILKLEPWLLAHRFYVPATIMKVSVSQKPYDFIQSLKRDEMAKFPFSQHDDILDTIGYGIEQIEEGNIKPKNEQLSSIDEYYDRNQRMGNLFR